MPSTQPPTRHNRNGTQTREGNQKQRWAGLVFLLCEASKASKKQQHGLLGKKKEGGKTEKKQMKKKPGT